MKVEAVTPAADASSMSHPNHARWVKERTLAMEVDHVKVIGGTLRDAEDTNARSLERMEQRAARRAAQPAIVGPAPSRRDRRIADGGVFRRAPTALVKPAKPSPCGRCGTCRHCMCERRICAIAQKASAGDMQMFRLMEPFALMAVRSQGRIGKFAGRSSRDVDRILTAAAEELCDRTIPLMGEWR